MSNTMRWIGACMAAICFVLAGPHLLRGDGPAKKAFYDLAGQAGLPKYLKCNQDTFADRDGVHGGESRTLDTDFLHHDFVFDIVFQFANENDRSRGFVGIGENSHDGGWVVNSLLIELSGPGIDGGKANWLESRKMGVGIGKLTTAGPHLLRMEKKGTELTCSVYTNYNGTLGKPEFGREILDLNRSAPFLNRLNSPLFFGGDVHFKSIRLEVDGQLVDPSLPNNFSAKSITDSEGLVKISSADPFPSYFVADSAIAIAPEGLDLDGLTLKTKEADFLDKDFTFDVVYRFKPQERAQMLIGLGENGRDSGNWILNSICSRVHGPGYNGIATVTYHNFVGEPNFATLGPDHAGPNLFRLEKRGNTLTMATMADFKGKFEPDYMITLPCLNQQCPYLTNKNTHLFLGEGAVIEQLRLIVTKPAAAQTQPSPPALSATLSVTAPPPKVAANQPPPSSVPSSQESAASRPAVADLTGSQYMIDLAGAARLPNFLEPPHDLTFSKDGLPLAGGKKIFRTKQADFIDKNFTFDIVFQFAAGERASLALGIGGSGLGDDHDANLTGAIYCRASGPAAGAHLTLGFDKTAQRSEKEWGKLGEGSSRKMLRIQKRNDTLLFAFCDDYNGTFKPTSERAVPKLREIAPYLKPGESPLFIEADGSILEQIRLVVNDQDIAATDIALTVPAHVVEGQSVHQATVKMPGDKQFAVQNAPAGLTISPSGDLAWTPTHDQIGHHQFSITITQKEATTTESVEIDVVSADDAKAVHGDLSKLDELYKLPLAKQNPAWALGLDNKSLLLLEATQLRRLGPDGFTVQETLKLPKVYEWIGERPDYFVAMSNEGKCLDIVNKKTMQITRSIQMDYHAHTDLCLNPFKNLSYVCVDKEMGRGFHSAILIVNEANGDVFEPDNFIGMWVKISPDGTTLYVSYPGLGDEILVAYDISGKTPRLLAAKKGAGSNALGLAISPDGKRLSYLSAGGHPINSHNIAAWDPTDLTKRPVSYPAKDNKADCKHVAFHPALPIAAAPTEGGAICFDRETGEVESNRLDLRAPLVGVKVNDLLFSPDGHWLLLDCEKKDERFLRRIKLNLSATEAATQAPIPSPPPPPAPTDSKDAPTKA